MGAVNYIFANTGQTVQLIVQTLDENGAPCDLGSNSNWLDGYGYLVDGYYTDAPDGYYPDGYQDGYTINDRYYVPVVNSVMFPDLSLDSEYPRPMSRISTGLYLLGLRLPNGVPAIGTYIASVVWVELETVVNSGFGTAVLVDGYVTVPVSGLPSNAVLTWSRVTPLGIIGDITILPESQTTAGFTLMSSSSYDNSIVNWSWVGNYSSSIFGTVTLIDGYATVAPIGGLPSSAVLTWNRVTPLGIIGDITILPGSQTTTGFTLMSSSLYDNSIVNWRGVCSSPSSVAFKTQWETYAINAVRPFGISAVTPV